MRVIYKYPLEITAEQVINIPMLYFDDRVARCNEQVLHVDVQDVIRPCLWCMVDTENQTYPMKVVTKMTGEEIREDEKDKLIEKISITVPIHDLDEPTINELSVLIKNNPGHSLLYFKVVDGEHNISLNLFSQNIRLNVTRELVDFLQENENIDFKING